MEKDVVEFVNLNYTFDISRVECWYLDKHVWKLRHSEAIPFSALQSAKECQFMQINDRTPVFDNIHTVLFNVELHILQLTIKLNII